ncbi:hypothetical protein ACFLSV_01600 [Bacteroidota bacterium]
MKNKEEVIKDFKRQVHRLNDRLIFLERRSDRYSWNRLKIFVSFLVISILAFSFAGSIIGWLVITVGLVLFSVTVHFHNKIVYAISRYKIYIGLKSSNLARIKLNWENIPESKGPTLNTHPFEVDLDIFGYKSLHRLINTSHSKEGSNVLRRYLLETGPKFSEVIAKQHLIRELTSLALFRDKFLLKAVSVSRKRFNGEKILIWLNNIVKVKANNSLLYIISLLVFSYVTLFVLFSLGFIQAVWLLPFILYLSIYTWFSKKSEELFKATELISDELSKVRILFEHIENIPAYNKRKLKEFLNSFLGSEPKPSLILRRLEKLSLMTSARGNPFMKIILNALMPWDFYLLINLTKSKNELKKRLPVWLNTLYELEALNSLANFAYLNPGYSFPEISENKNGKNVLYSENMGHPLIPFDVKVTNDFSIQKKNEILIITGSNMSGKSTFLKTIGANLCLAYAGAPVNADVLRVSLFRLFTCIKTSDSITDGISYFYAEVKRLKEMLDELERSSTMPLFFLIDEIFRGTNNKERSIGSRSYLKTISRMETFGIVATHDLNLIELEKEINNITNYHFREEIINEKMVFDYKLHPGPCPTTNAIKVMQLAGLPITSEK